MKNLKRVLALALAFALSMTLVAGAAFTDEASIGADYKDDVSMLVQLGVINGYEDGSFKPQNNITRAEFCKMAYTLKYGYDDQGKLFVGQKSIFTDVENDAGLAWAKGYINYCYNQGIVGGVGANKFNPKGNVTVAEASKMLLVILGCDASKENFGGSNWAGNVVAKAMELGVFNGWVGDPTEPATRELVCKLMRNTVFAATYIYNPITGIGSQVSALDPSVKNETLGEKTMGLKHVSGIVVSNERYALETDEEGKILSPMANVQPKDKSQVYYEVTESKNSALNGQKRLLTLDVGMDDEMLGSLVDVYFTADGEVGTYSNVKVIGDVLVSAKTVAYDVMAADIKIMPDGETTSKTEIKPYILFATEDGEKRVDVRDDPTTSANESSFKAPRNVKYSGEVFGSRMYYSDVTATGTSASLTRLAGTNWSDSSCKKMHDEMGETYMQKYRFVSVDGGETYAYILRLTNMKSGKVGSVSSSSVTISGAGGAKDLDDEAVLLGDVTKGELAVFYMLNDKLYVEPTTKINGKATNFKSETATINGEKYYLDLGGKLASYKTLSGYFTASGNTGKNNDNTKFTVFGSYVLDIDATVAAGNASDYAVVLYSTYDSDLGTAKAKFAFSNNTEAVYEISKCYGSDDESNDEMKDFINNGKVGALYRVRVVNGMADLSAAEGSVVNTAGGNISAGKFIVGSDSYVKDVNSIVYLIYGGKDLGAGQYSALKAKPYKLSNLQDAAGKEVMISNGSAYIAQNLASAVVNDGNSSIRTLLVGSMTVGDELANINAKTDNIAFVLEAKKNYNTDTNKWFLDVKMIGENGLVETRTIDDVRNDSGANVYFSGSSTVGTAAIPRGTLVAYKLTAAEAEGATGEWIDSIGDNNGMGSIARMSAPYTAASGDGYYRVVIGAVEDDLIGFWAYGYTQDADDTDVGVDFTLEKDEHDFKVIAIDDDTFVEGGDIETAGNGDTIDADDYNAIIVVEGGKITRIFSLYNNF